MGIKRLRSRWLTRLFQKELITTALGTFLKDSLSVVCLQNGKCEVSSLRDQRMSAVVWMSKTFIHNQNRHLPELFSLFSCTQSRSICGLSRGGCILELWRHHYAISYHVSSGNCCGLPVQNGHQTDLQFDADSGHVGQINLKGCQNKDQRKREIKYFYSKVSFSITI